MNLEVLEPHPHRVLAAFRRGEFDGLEIVGRADETAFFQLCLREKLLAALADTMPTARTKAEVPPWFILAANLSLKLHGEHSFLAWEQVVRCGGLLAALPPELATKHLDAAGQRVLLNCTGFNDKNSYNRQAPCDQDTLRKFVRDVPAQAWQDWFNTGVLATFQQYGFIDPAGEFVGDASYLFVPDNAAYEGSIVLWFDEHNHPVDYDRLTAAERARVRRRRCYKLVTLLHLRGESRVWAGVRLVPGNTHELPVLYDLVAQVVKTLGVGVIKRLILDRGFVDGARIAYCKTVLGIDILIPLKRNMDLWQEAWAAAQHLPWEPRTEPAAPAAPPVDRPPALARREASRQATLARQRAEAPPPPPASVLVRDELCVVKDLRWAELPLPWSVVLLRETYADGHQAEWALLDTATVTDGQQPPRCYHRRTTTEEGYRQLKCFYDLTDFHSRSGNAITAQVVLLLLSYTLRQWQLWRSQATEVAGTQPERIRQELDLQDQFVIIHYQQAYVQLPLLTFTREVLELSPAARALALAQIRVLERSFLTPLINLRPP